MKKDLAFEQAYVEVLNDEKTSRLDFLKEEFSKKVPNKESIAELLNIAIIDETLAEYNYFASYNLSKTEGKNDFDPEFQQHESEERDHRYKLVERLRELNLPVPVVPLSQYQTMNSDGENWKQEMDFESGSILVRRLEEEQKAVKFYSFVLEFINRDKSENRDSSTYKVIREIKADEQTHIKDLRDLAAENKLV